MQHMDIMFESRASRADLIFDNMIQGATIEEGGSIALTEKGRLFGTASMILIQIHLE